ncbi:MAG: WbqC family protein [Sphingobacteriaceae bacterium]|nr:WbqC family protein [Sphingobacteriaceae bacterium]
MIENTMGAFIIMELQYLPDVSYLTKIANKPLVLLENCEHFVKSSARNRTSIYSANGRQLLSIPIAGGRSHKQMYCQTAISYQNDWPKQHWFSIKSAYGKAPFFEYYESELAHLFLERPQLLWDWNMTWTKWLLKKMGLKTQLGYTEKFRMDYPVDVDYRYPKLSGYGAVCPPYYQCFTDRFGFLPNLSGLDLLLNVGPTEAHQYLIRSSSI